MESLEPQGKEVVIVNIEGSIGVGKSTLLANLRARLADDQNCAFVDEPVDTWERAGLLAAMYDGSLSHAAFQLTALATRFAALVRTLADRSARLVLSERSIFSDRDIFAKVHLSEVDARAYALAHDSLVGALPRSLTLVTILLDAPVPTLVERVRRRGRASEAEGDGGGVGEEYLRTLADAHEAYVEKISHAYARVDALGPPDEVCNAVCAAIEAAAPGTLGRSHVPFTKGAGDDREVSSPTSVLAL